MESDYYEVLMVREGATEEEIRVQYRRLAAVLHPDANPQRPDLAGERMKLLNEAKDVLLDPARRAEYDARRRAEVKVDLDQAAGLGQDAGEPEGEWGWESAGSESSCGPGEDAANAGPRVPQSTWGRVQECLPLTGIWGEGGYFWLTRFAWAIASAFGAGGVVLGFPVLAMAAMCDLFHAVASFLLLSWWLGEHPLLTYPLIGLVAWCENRYDGPWWFIPMFGIGLVGRVLTLPKWLRATAGPGSRRLPG